MRAELRQAIDAANQAAGVGRQKVYSKKTYLKQTEAQVIDMLCDRIEELQAAIKTKGDTRGALNALAQAGRMARRREQ